MTAPAKPAKRGPKPRKPIKRGKPLGWKRRAAKAKNTVDPDVLEAILVFYGRKCAYCPDGCLATQWDHIVPIAHGGRHTAANLAPICGRCNMAKGTLPWQPRKMHSYA